MTLLVKICGLRTPEALDAARCDTSARHGRLRLLPAVGPAISASRMRASWASASRAAQEGRAVGQRRRYGTSARSSKRFELDLLPRQGDAGARHRGALRVFACPVMKAMPIASHATLCRSRSTKRSLTACCSTAVQATRPGGLGTPFQLAVCGKSPARRAVHAVGWARCRQRGGGAAHHAGALGRRLLGR